jgi:hypothetical protein
VIFKLNGCCMASLLAGARQPIRRALRFRVRRVSLCPRPIPNILAVPVQIGDRLRCSWAFRLSEHAVRVCTGDVRGD